MYSVFRYSLLENRQGERTASSAPATGFRSSCKGGQGMCSKRSHIPTILFLLPLLLCGPLSSAQAGPKYNVATEAKFTGTIEDLKVPPKGKEKEIEYLTIKSGTDTLDLYLCPKSFIDEMGVNLAKGDEVAFTGSKVKQGDADLILTKELVKGTDTLVLRDDKGNPVWNWKY